MTDDWKLWNDGLIPKMAQTIYDEKRFDLVPIFADALDESGYPDHSVALKLRDTPSDSIRVFRFLAPIIGGELKDSVEWIEEFVKRFVRDEWDIEEGNPEITYESLMGLAPGGRITQYGRSSWQEEFYSNSETFYNHYEIAAGTKIEDSEIWLFGCSC